MGAVFTANHFTVTEKQTTRKKMNINYAKRRNISLSVYITDLTQAQHPVLSAIVPSISIIYTVINPLVPELF